MSESVWRLSQQTRQLQSVCSDARGLWNDNAAKHIEQRYLGPHSQSASTMVAELQAQARQAERCDEQVTLAREHAVSANRHAAHAGEMVSESERSQSSAYEYAQQAWQHEQETARLEALALDLALAAGACCSGCPSHRGDHGSSSVVSMREAPSSKHLYGVTDEELGALKAYLGDDYEEMNLLFSGAPRVSAEDRVKYSVAGVEANAPKLNAAMRALEKLPVHKGVVYRGTDMTASELAPYQKGETVIQSRFLSTSTDFATSEGFRGNGNVRLRIESSNGRDVTMISGHKEFEVTFPYATRMLVTDVSQLGSIIEISMRDV